MITMETKPKLYPFPKCKSCKVRRKCKGDTGYKLLCGGVVAPTKKEVDMRIRQTKTRLKILRKVQKGVANAGK